MSLERLQNTRLWRNSLAAIDNDPYKSDKEELRVAFIQFRKNAAQLVAQIAHHLPGLTQHDISHLDALWETASLIAGDSYPINPLEGFVLGGAILLHDSALCFEAYNNGIDGIRSTTTWKDAYSALSDAKKDITDEELKGNADFAALRHLHASQAAELIERNWIDPDTGQSMYLLESSSLRKHLGQLIGQIAASHHWDIEKVATALQQQVNSLSSYPREWRIDPIKIACLLRCADAAHIDNERAPDFLHALLKRNGISFNHWQAQNRLARVDIDQSDSSLSTILFTSTRNFKEVEAESWWVAYDATCLVDREIKASNALLESLKKDTFQVKRVKGVEAPNLMAAYIKVEGWLPHSAELHVGNIERLVENLGGEKLYGSGIDTLEISIRELVQNARDAIQARRIIESEFKGRITVKILQEGNETWLIVEDNGVGMSERVLTGPLSDFGTSFWTSSLVQSEFPGLRSSKFKSVGQFGIGFYSVFMVAKEVYVTTKSWKEGLSNTNQLLFKNGVSLRPLFKKGAPENFNSLVSTQVKLKLKKDTIDSDLTVEVKQNTLGSTNLKVQFEDYLSAICAGLDVSVYLLKEPTPAIQVHQNIEASNLEKEIWLNQISFSKYQDSTFLSLYISNNISRLKFITENEKVLGFAAISTESTNEQNFLNIMTVGGLASSVHNRHSTNFIGFIDHSPKSAKREGDTYTASKPSIINWAQEQLEILKRTDLNPNERYIAASSLSHFNVDPTSIASILVIINRQQIFLSFDELADLSSKTNIAILKSTVLNGHVEIYPNINYLDGYALIWPLINSNNFLSLKMKADIPEKNNSIIDCLHRAIVRKGKTPIWSIKEAVGTSSLGGGRIDALIISAT